MNNTGHYIGCTCRQCIPGLDDRPYQVSTSKKRAIEALERGIREAKERAREETKGQYSPEKCVCPFCNYHSDLDRNKETA